MVPGSLAVLSSPSSFPSCSTCDSTFLSNSANRSWSFGPFTRSPRFRSFCPAPRNLEIKAFTGPRMHESSAENFPEVNTVGDFLRYKQSVDGISGELQTAVVCYRKKFPWNLVNPFLQVDLVSTIHIADKEYFATIQKELKPYDCVLYEMVASKESLSESKNPMLRQRSKCVPSSSFNFVGFFQKQIARVIMLEFQLDGLDFCAENWYHADLDYETFESLQIEKGESLFTFAREMSLKSTKVMVQSTSKSEEIDSPRSFPVLPMPLIGLLIIGSFGVDLGSQVSEIPELRALSRLDFGAALKFFLAKQITSDLMQDISDIEQSSVIIGERNKAATRTLETAMKMGHNKIAILYGCGHMPDLGRRLRDEFNMVPCRVQWLTAWSIVSRDSRAADPLPLLGEMAEFLRWPLNRYQTLALLLLSSFLALDLYFWEVLLGYTAKWFSEFVDGGQMFW